MSSLYLDSISLKKSLNWRWFILHFDVTNLKSFETTVTTLIISRDFTQIFLVFETVTDYQIPIRCVLYVVCDRRRYDGVSKSFRTGPPVARTANGISLSATRYCCFAILWVSLVSLAAIILCVASQRVFIVVVYFVIDSVRQLLDTPSYTTVPCDHTWELHASPVQSVSVLGYPDYVTPSRYYINVYLQWSLSLPLR
jgi:hypothetical protein